MARSMCGVQLKDKNRANYMMLGLNGTIYQLAKANNMHWYCHVLMREDGHVLRRTLNLEV